MVSATENSGITVGILALQGAFNEHIQLLELAASILPPAPQNLSHPSWIFLQVRTVTELDRCDALIIPGGESTAISLVAQRSNLLEPLRDFVKVRRNPTWGTCAGLILLAESANRTKQGGQELIGGLDVRVKRNHFGRQTESFQAALELPFLRRPVADSDETVDPGEAPFSAIFIRAPIVEKLLPNAIGAQEGEAQLDDTVVAPSRAHILGPHGSCNGAPVEVLATLPRRAAALGGEEMEDLETEAGVVVAVRQGNVFGTSFHPELTGDPRIHVWWLQQVSKAFDSRRG